MTRRIRLPRLTPRERYALLVAVGLIAVLVGVAQVWPPGAWILGGALAMVLGLVGLAGVRSTR